MFLSRSANLYNRARAAVTLLLLAGFGACAGSIPRAESGPGAVGPAAAVDRFLQLAGESNYVQMGWVFGTTSGPLIQRDPLPEVEKRMYALASVLQHDAFVVGPPTAVPGRVGNAMSFDVQIQRNGRNVVVPITTVRGPDGRWFVEQVSVEAVTNVRG